jgi:hypothetical protein
MTTTAKSLRRTVLGVALLALGGTATAQPNDTTSNTPTPTASPTTSDDSTSTTTTTTTTDTDTTTNTGTNTNADGTNTNAAPTPPSRDDDAIAHPAGPPTVYVQPTTVVTPGQNDTEQPMNDNSSLYERYGIAVMLGGGVEGFVQTPQRDATDDGGVWNLRVAVGTRSPLAIEAAYIGSAQSINGLGLESDALLVGNGAQADARINLTDALVQPFVYGGVAWKRYSLERTTTRTSDLSDNDDVLEVPLGIGIASKYAGLLLDLRGEYRFSTQDDMFDVTAPDDRMDRWGVNANIGYAF